MVSSSHYLKQPGEPYRIRHPDGGIQCVVLEGSELLALVEAGVVVEGLDHERAEWRRVSADTARYGSLDGSC